MLKKMLLAAVSVALFSAATGCSATRSMTIPLETQPGACRVEEVRPSVLSTVAYTVCWDSKGRVLGMVGGTTTGALAGAAGVAEPIALLGGAGIIGATVGSNLSSLASTAGSVGAAAR
jgi:hypothetical protein